MWFKKLFKWSSSSGNPTTLNLRDLIGRQASSGEIISPQSILKHPAVLNAVREISNYCARIPFDCYRKIPEGGREKLVYSPAQKILKNPSELYTPSCLISAWVVNAITHGNGYIWILRNEIGQPIELLLLDSGSTYTAIENGRLIYSTYVDNKLTKIQSDDLLVLKGLSSDGVTGLPLWSLLADSFGLGITITRYQNLFFKNSGRPHLLINLPPEISTQEEIEQFKDDWRKAHSSIQNSFKSALLMNGMTVNVLPTSNETAQVDQLCENDIRTISNAIGIRSYLIGGKQNVSYKSLTEERLAFLDQIDSWVTQIEQQLTIKLIRSRDLSTCYIEGNRKATLQILPEDETKLLIEQRNNGLISDEEAREVLNRPVDFENGTFWLPSNLQLRGDKLKATEEHPEQVAPELQSVDEDEIDVDDEPQELMLELMLEFMESAAAITKRNIERLLRRAEKAGKLELSIWEETFTDLHGSYKLKDLLPIEEFEQVLPEQQKYVLDQIDIEHLTEELWRK